MSIRLRLFLAIGSFASASALIGLSIFLFRNTHRCSMSTAQLVSQTLWGHDVKVPLAHKLIICGLVFPAIFILCGIAVFLNGLRVFYPLSQPLLVAHIIMLAVVTLGTLCGGALQCVLFTSVIRSVEELDNDLDGCLVRGGNRLNEVLEMVKESVIVLSDDLTVLHCNQIGRAHV